MDAYLQSPLFLTSLKVILTITATLLLNTGLRSLIKIPKKLDSRRGRTYVAVVRSAISILLFTIALHIIFLLLGINIIPLLASAGIVGIAIGIGARSLIEDLIAGVFLLTQTTTAIGDHVVIGDSEGIIQDIGFRTITIRATNGSLIVIPNAQVKQVVNYSSSNAVLFLDIPVKTGQNVDVIIQILTEIITTMKTEKQREYPVKDASQVLGIGNIQAGNCMLMRTKIVTTSGGRNSVEREYRYRVAKTFAEKKIVFA